MTTVPQTYVEELRAELGYYPMWLPTDPIAIGDYGTFQGGVFRVQGNVQRDKGIDLEVIWASSKNPINRHRGLTFSSRVNADADVGAVNVSGGVAIATDREHAWGFAASGAQLGRVGNLPSVATAIKALADDGRWERKLLLVTEAQAVDRLVVIIARSRGISIDAHVQGTMSAPSDVLLGGGTSLSYKAEDAYVLPGALNTTPLFRLHKLSGFMKSQVLPVAGDNFVTEPPWLQDANEEPMEFEPEH